MDKHSNEDMTVLTDEQTAQVAGGLYSPIGPVGGLCLTCTSGHFQDFKNAAASAAKA